MPIQLKNFNLGGLADSNYLGAPNSYAESVGLDIHSVPGLLRVNQALTKDSGSTITEFCKNAIAASNGEKYFFSADSGKIWARNTSGTYRLVLTTVPTGGSTGCLGAVEFNNYLYWATSGYLHRILLSNATDATWSTNLAQNWATFTNGNTSYHPMWELSLSLYIGDGNFVAAVYTDVTPTGAFTANALDLPKNNVITILNNIGATDLVIGTTIASSVNYCKIYRWSYWAPSWTSEDWCPEVGLNAFIPIDNGIFVSAGTKGNLYQYNGANLINVKSIKGSFSGTTKATVYGSSVLNFIGLPLFAVSNTSGNPCLLGIYSFGSHNNNYKPVLNLEYISSQGVTSNIEYGAMIGNGDTFLVAWKDSTSSPVYGVDILDLSNKFTGAYIISRIIIPVQRIGRKLLQIRDSLTNVKNVSVGYATLPTNTDITISKIVNGGSTTAVTSATAAKTNTKQALVDVGNATTVQVKVALTVSGNTAPTIEEIDINL